MGGGSFPPYQCLSRWAFACAVLVGGTRKGDTMSKQYLVVADDAIVYRADSAERARGYADAHHEHAGEDVEIFEVVSVDPPKGGAA